MCSAVGLPTISIVVLRRIRLSKRMVMRGEDEDKVNELDIQNVS
jgi:hypothetical protein